MSTNSALQLIIKGVITEKRKTATKTRTQERKKFKKGIDLHVKIRRESNMFNLQARKI
jgi:hypothetical protein